MRLVLIPDAFNVLKPIYNQVVIGLFTHKSRKI